MVLLGGVSFEMRIVGYLAIVLRAYQFVISSRLGKVFAPYSYQNQRFGRAIGLLLALLWVNTDRLEESERRLCHLDDAKLLKWRDSYVTIFNVVPIAVSRKRIETIIWNLL